MERNPVPIRRIFPHDERPILNIGASHLVARFPIYGQTKTNLRNLTRDMNDDDCGLIGDIVQMSPQHVVPYAQAVLPPNWNPEKLVAQLEKQVLNRLGLGFNMIVPRDWIRYPCSIVRRLLDERPARLDTAAREAEREHIRQLKRPDYLKLVT